MTEKPPDGQGDNDLMSLLVIEYQCGKTAAIEPLVKLFSPVVLRFVHSLVGNLSAAQDVAQETWLSIFRGLPRLRDPDAFKPWALQIAHRRSMDFLRTAKRRKEISIDSLQKTKDFEAASESESGPKLPDAVHLAIEKLNSQQRLLLKLFYVEGFRVREIAEIVSQPEGTVKYNLFQLRSIIREEVEKKGTEHES